MGFVITIFSGLMGAWGIVLAAAAAHLAPGTGLDSAAIMLLVHAVAILSVTSLSEMGRVSPKPAYIALAGWLVGAVLFAADITLRAFAGFRLFPMAAPTGGTIMIGAWLALTAAGALYRR